MVLIDHNSIDRKLALPISNPIQTPLVDPILQEDILQLDRGLEKIDEGLSTLYAGLDALDKELSSVQSQSILLDRSMTVPRSGPVKPMINGSSLNRSMSTFLDPQTAKEISEAFRNQLLNPPEGWEQLSISSGSSEIALIQGIEKP